MNKIRFMCKENCMNDFIPIRLDYGNVQSVLSKKPLKVTADLWQGPWTS